MGPGASFSPCGTPAGTGLKRGTSLKMCAVPPFPKCASERFGLSMVVDGVVRNFDLETNI